METLTQIFYKGYTIEADPYDWFNRYTYYPTAQGIDHDADMDEDGYHYCGNCGWADSIDEAKDAIWEKVMMAIPQHKVVINGRDYYFDWIDDAIKFSILWNADEFIPGVNV